MKSPARHLQSDRHFDVPKFEFPLQSFLHIGTTTNLSDSCNKYKWFTELKIRTKEKKTIKRSNPQMLSILLQIDI
jgi:hypothetical protein